MPKARTDFRCRECGYQTPRPLGRCPECESWSSFDEVSSTPASPVRASRTVNVAARPLRLEEVDTADFARIGVPLQEFARVLGGGIVPGSVTLIGGDPGVGKSTLALQISCVLSEQRLKVLYVSGEESIKQAKMR